MTVKELCEKINLQEQVQCEVMRFSEAFDFGSVGNVMERLKRPKEWDTARMELEKLLVPDEGKIGMLACMLICAADLYDEYKRLGIEESVYVDTMKCFPRFIEECKEKTGSYAFDRSFWTVRQIGMRLFRIGTLEYEICEWEGEEVISIHIPSDAVLSEDMCEKSFCQAERFMDHFFPKDGPWNYICNSWLLAPALKELLPPSSNIIKFQNKFEMIEQNMDGTEYLEWVYQGAKCSIEELPENTMLQKKIKEHLLSGGKIGEATGIVCQKVCVDKNRHN